MEGTTGLTIRPAASADLPVLGRLGALLVTLHHELDPQRFISETPGKAEGYARHLAHQLLEAAVVVLVAEQNGKVLGYTYSALEGADYMALRGPAGVVYDLVVEPTHRRRGIGRLLLTRTLQVLVERGAPYVTLSAAANNASARHLFSQMGFRATMIEMGWDPNSA